uniref:AIG1-type G domain-containing protein n=1 Tax=Neolamprologus brichardi TaxID=32507 RepID=A0A3Q4GED0_NEOBR
FQWKNHFNTHPSDFFTLQELTGEPSNKSLSGNIILGQNVFDTSRRTAQSVAGQQEVHGRRVTVVDTPGWWWHYPLENTPKLDQIEIQNSVHLCPPGPHAFLLVFHHSFFIAVQEHMRLFRDDVWKHTIVLFTRGDWLGVKTVEERIESEEGLQWLMKQCGNRYHVLDNMKDDDEMQVQDLLEKIEEMWAGNEDSHYKVDPDREAQLEARKEAEGKLARWIRKTTKRQSRILGKLFEGNQEIIK